MRRLGSSERAVLSVKECPLRAVDAEAGKEKRVRAKDEAWAFCGEPEVAVWLTASPRKGRQGLQRRREGGSFQRSREAHSSGLLV